MSGSPNRPIRSDFGPLKVRSRIATIDPEEELPPEIARLMFWQIAGLGLAGNRFWALATYAPTEYTVAAWGSCARPDDQSIPKPLVQRTSAGVLVVKYDTTYDDETGTAITTQLYGAVVIPQALTYVRSAQQVNANGKDVDVRLWDAAGVATDSSFLIVSW
jgi:hypothetical protein